MHWWFKKKFDLISIPKDCWIILTHKTFVIFAIFKTCQRWNQKQDSQPAIRDHLQIFSASHTTGDYINMFFQGFLIWDSLNISAQSPRVSHSIWDRVFRKSFVNSGSSGVKHPSCCRFLFTIQECSFIDHLHIKVISSLASSRYCGFMQWTTQVFYLCHWFCYPLPVCICLKHPWKSQVTKCGMALLTCIGYISYCHCGCWF